MMMMMKKMFSHYESHSGARLTRDAARDSIASLMDNQSSMIRASVGQEDSR